jgi:hypothetical protein
MDRIGIEQCRVIVLDGRGRGRSGDRVERGVEMEVG